MAFKQDMAAREKAESEKKAKEPEAGPSIQNATAFAMRPATSKSLCQIPACVQDRNERDRLKETLRDEEEFKAIIQNIRETAERKTPEVKKPEPDLLEACIQQGLLQGATETESGLRKMVNERDARIKVLEKKCADLEAERKGLKGESMAYKRARVEDYFSENEVEKPEKKKKSG